MLLQWLFFCQNHVCGREADARGTAVAPSCAGLLWRRAHELVVVVIVVVVVDDDVAVAATVGGAVVVGTAT